MFQRNESLLRQYYAHTPQSQETLVDFGMTPTDPLDQEDWEAEASRFLTVLTSRGYPCLVVMGASVLCTLFD